MSFDTVPLNCAKIFVVPASHSYDRVRNFFLQSCLSFIRLIKINVVVFYQQLLIVTVIKYNSEKTTVSQHI
jgi:hypothetical protein